MSETLVIVLISLAVAFAFTVGFVLTHATRATKMILFGKKFPGRRYE